MEAHDESPEARRRRFLDNNLDKAHQAKRELAELRRELKDGTCDPYELLEGNSERWEGRVERMEVQKVLTLIPGVKTARMIEVLLAVDAAPTSKLGSFTWQRRKAISQAVRDVREVNV